MAEQIEVGRTYTAGGRSYNGGTTLQADAVSGFDKSATVNPVPVAVQGTLSVRTDDDTGTLTMDSASHGIVTGQFVSLFWEVGGVKGARRNVVVGVVAGTSVPFDLGAGDVLPAAASVIKVGKCVTEEINVPTSDLVSLVAKADLPATGHRWHNVLKTAGDVEVLNVTLSGNGNSYGWDNASGVATPIGTAVTKATVCHESLTAPLGCSVYAYKN
jgi:hypothetical protein